MDRRGRHRWLGAIALVGAFLLLWNRLHIWFVVQLNLFSLLILFAVLATGLYAALKLLFSR